MELDRAEIFNAILVRNQLRREAHLPLLDVRATFEREVAQALWRAHVDAHYSRVRAEVLGRFRARHGPEWGQSTGGRWSVDTEVWRLLHMSFQRA